MLLIVGVVTVIALVIIRKTWMPGGANPTPLGWMSEQWLAEHRRSVT